MAREHRLMDQNPSIAQGPMIGLASRRSHDQVVSSIAQLLDHAYCTKVYYNRHSWSHVHGHRHLVASDSGEYAYIRL